MSRVERPTSRRRLPALMVPAVVLGILLPIAHNTVSARAQDGDMATVAGGGGLSGRALNSAVAPGGLATDPGGDVFATDPRNDRIVEVTPGGTLTTVAGTGYPSSGPLAGGPTASTPLKAPRGLARAANGVLFASTGDRTLAYASGSFSPTGQVGAVVSIGPGGIHTLATLAFSPGSPCWAVSDGFTPGALAVDGSGNLFVADSGGKSVCRLAPDGTATVVVGGLADPEGLAVDSAGDLFIADKNSYVVRKVDPQGNMTVVAGDGQSGNGGDGGPATSAEFFGPTGVVVGPAGDLYVADLFSIRHVDSAGVITTIAGGQGNRDQSDGIPATSAQLAPFALALGAAGQVITTDGASSNQGAFPRPPNRIRVVATNGVITTIAGNGSDGTSGDGGSATQAQLGTPAGIAVGPHDDVFVADSRDGLVRRLAPDGTITTIVGGGGNPDNNPPSGPASGLTLAAPSGVAVDSNGNVYVADMETGSVYRVTPGGAYQTVTSVPSAQQPLPNSNGVAVTADGTTVFVGELDPGTSKPVIKRVAADGTVATYAVLPSGRSPALSMAPDGSLYAVTGQAVYHVVNGSVATVAWQPQGSSPYYLGADTAIADPVGDLFVAAPCSKSSGVYDIAAAGSCIAELAADGTSHTIAGPGSPGMLGDGGPASAATFSCASAGCLALDSSANLLISDTLDHRLRRITSPVPYGPPTALFTAQTASFGSGNATVPVAANGCASTNALTYAWTWPGGSTAPLSVCRTVVDLPTGDVPLTLTVTNLRGAQATATHTLTLLPAARVSSEETAGANHAVTLVLSGCDSVGSATFTWQLTGPSQPPAQAQSGCTDTVAGIPPGSYTVTLTVGDGAGRSASTTQDIQVDPIADIKLLAEDPVDFSATSVPVHLDACASSGASQYTWSTSAGTSTVSTCSDFTVALAPGQQEVHLDAGDGHGHDGTADISIYVLGGVPPRANPSSCQVFGADASACWAQDPANFWGAPTHIRPPDFITLEVSGGVDVAGVSVGLAMACDGSLSASVGVWAGISVSQLGGPVGGSIGFGWFGDMSPDHVPTNQAIDDLLTGPSVGAGYSVGSGFFVFGSHGVHGVVITASTDISATVAFSWGVDIGSPIPKSLDTFCRGGVFAKLAQFLNASGGGVGSGGAATAAPRAAAAAPHAALTPAAPKAPSGASAGISTLAGGLAAHQAATSIGVRPGAVSVQPDGRVLVADQSGSVIRRLESDGSNTVLAGDGVPGFSGDGGPATAAQLLNPTGLAVGPDGSLYIADTGNSRVRRVSPQGVITTFAGTGVPGFSGDGGPAGSAQLAWPDGVAVDAAGNVYVADTHNNVVRKVSLDGTITTVAGDTTPGYAGDGGPATRAELVRPASVATDVNGDVYIADTLDNRIRRVGADGTISTVAGTGAQGNSGDGGPATAATLNGPSGLEFDGSGALVFADSRNQSVRMVGTDGTITTLSSSIGDPEDVAVSSVTGTIFIADTRDGQVLALNLGRQPSVVAGNGARSYSGDGLPGAQAQLSAPGQVAVDVNHNVYLADAANNRVRRIDRAGVITTVAGNGTAGSGGDGGPATQAALDFPVGVAVDTSGNVYIADSANAEVRRVDTSGTIVTIAGTGVPGFGGDGGPATSAQLSSPRSVAVDAAGDVYIADTGNQRIRKVLPDGTITTFAGNGTLGFTGDDGPATSAELNRPQGVAVDVAGDVDIADTGNSRVRRVLVAGIISTVAGDGVRGSTGDGGAATSAELAAPTGVAVDGTNTLYIADVAANRVRTVDAAGSIATLAGTGSFDETGDGGSAAGATLAGPWGVGVDLNGTVVVSDASGDRVREITANSVPTPSIPESPWVPLLVVVAAVVGFGSRRRLGQGVVRLARR